MNKSTFIKTSLAAALLGMSFFAVSCRNEGPDEPICVILDTDIGSSTDDLFAMKLLYDYMDEGKADVLAMMVDRPGDNVVEYLEKFNAYYDHGDIPVGVVHDFPGPDPYKFIPYAEDGVLPECFEEIEVTDPGELPYAEDLYHDVLVKAKDHSVEIISLGFLTNIGRLVDKYPEVVSRKVKSLYIMGGSIRDTLFHSYNTAMDVDAAKSVFRKWPTKIYVSPAEAGRMLDYLREDVLEDYEAGSPIRWVYEVVETDTGQKMWDVLSVFEAIEGPKPFIYSKPGHIRVVDDGSTMFEAEEGGNVVYHTLTQASADSLYTVLRSHGDNWR